MTGERSVAETTRNFHRWHSYLWKRERFIFFLWRSGMIFTSTWGAGRSSTVYKSEAMNGAWILSQECKLTLYSLHWEFFFVFIVVLCHRLVLTRLFKRFRAQGASVTPNGKIDMLSLNMTELRVCFFLTRVLFYTQTGTLGGDGMFCFLFGCFLSNLE